MIVIADNLNTRNKKYMDALKSKDKKALSGLLLKLSSADIINVQCSLDGSTDEDALPWVVGIIGETIDKPVSIDSRNIEATGSAIKLCKTPPIINYLSYTEPDDVEELLDMVSDSGASLVLRASKTTPPSSFEAKLQIIEELIESANSADIPNDRLYADPSLVHIGRGAGQRHLANSTECIRVIRELLDPPIKTIAWISNVSTGLPINLRKTIEASYFTYLAGAGLSAAMLDVMDETIKKAIYLTKSYNDEVVFSPADLS